MNSSRPPANQARFNPDAEFAYVYAEGIVAGIWNYRITLIDGGAQLEIAINLSRRRG